MHTCTAGAAALDATGWQQVFVHDEGMALLAIAQQHGQLAMYLWRQLGSSSNQQFRAWMQLPALPALPAGSPALQLGHESTLCAVFVQQGWSGLQLCVAHAAPVSTGAASSPPVCFQQAQRKLP